MRGADQGNGAQALGAVLTTLQRQWRRGAAARTGLSLPEILVQQLGADRAAAVGFGGISARGTLTLTVDAASLRAEMDTFHRAGLLAAIQGTPEGARIRTLRFVTTGGRDGR